MTLQEKFQKEIIPKLQQELNKKNKSGVPKLTKIVVNVGLKEALGDKKVMEIAAKDISVITGQKPMITKAKKAIAAFKLQRGDEIGLKVTLRGKRMFSFFEKLVSIVLPRVRDFRGVSSNSFDEKGNYTLGIPEYTVFPEIELAKVDKIRGLEITIVISSKTKEEGKKLLELLGMPFNKTI